MRNGRPTPTQTADRRAKVAALFMVRMTQADIALAVDASPTTIGNDIRLLRAQWQKAMVDDPMAVKRRELAELDEMERVAALRQNEPEWWNKRLEAKRHRAKLLGLYENPEVYVDQRMQTAVVVGDERDVKTILLERFTRIIERRGANGIHPGPNGGGGDEAPLSLEDMGTG